MSRMLLIFLLGLAMPAMAQQLEPLEEPLPPPDLIEEDFESLEPEVTILQRDGDQIQEYRIDGRLYMVKVTPAHGVPYYLVDQHGDGVMTRQDRQPKLSVPMWVIKSW